jgi:multiple sugar transport system substrate-binding protein
MIELRGITWDHPRGYAPLQSSIEPYYAQFNVRITWEKRSLKDFGDSPIDVLARDYDLLIIDHPHMGLGLHAQCLVPLDSYLSAETLETLAEQSAGLSHASYTYEGHQWALANDAAMQTSYYRPDLLNAPLPQDWDAVIRLGEQVRARNQWVAIPLCPTDAICSFLSLCASHDAPLGQEQFVERGTALHVLQFMRDLYRVSHPQSADWNPIRLLDAMSHTDEIVYCPLSFCYTNYARNGFAPHLILFHDIPSVRGAILGGAGIAVSALSKHPEAACAYAAWISSAEVQKTLYLESGGQPGNRIAWEDEQANALTHNFFRDTRATLDAAYLRPRFYGWHIFQEQAGVLIHRMLIDGGSPEQTYGQLNHLYENYLP